MQAHVGHTLRRLSLASALDIASGGGGDSGQVRGAPDVDSGGDGSGSSRARGKRLSLGGASTPLLSEALIDSPPARPARTSRRRSSLTAPPSKVDEAVAEPAPEVAETRAPARSRRRCSGSFHPRAEAEPAGGAAEGEPEALWHGHRSHLTQDELAVTAHAAACTLAAELAAESAELAAQSVAPARRSLRLLRPAAASQPPPQPPAARGGRAGSAPPRQSALKRGTGICGATAQPQPPASEPAPPRLVASAPSGEQPHGGTAQLGGRRRSTRLLAAPLLPLAPEQADVAPATSVPPPPRGARIAGAATRRRDAAPLRDLNTRPAEEPPSAPKPHSQSDTPPRGIVAAAIARLTSPRLAVRPAGRSSPLSPARGPSSSPPTPLPPLLQSPAPRSPLGPASGAPEGEPLPCKRTAADSRPRSAQGAESEHGLEAHYLGASGPGRPGSGGQPSMFPFFSRMLGGFRRRASEPVLCREAAQPLRRVSAQHATPRRIEATLDKCPRSAASSSSAVIASRDEELPAVRDRK